MSTETYPVRVDASLDPRLSRGLVLVKWWLLAIPRYIIVGLFAGGGTWAAWRLGSHDFNWAGGGLIGILVLIAAIVLTVTGSYPQSLFDFILGLNRWVIRVAAYAGLMTDRYPRRAIWTPIPGHAQFTPEQLREVRREWVVQPTIFWRSDNSLALGAYVCPARTCVHDHYEP